MTDSLTIAHLTDAHLPLHGALRPGELISKRALTALNWLRKRARAHDPRIVEAITADIRAHAPDHIAMTGDAVNFGLEREFVAAAQWLGGLGAPEDVSFVPGNHEAIAPGVEAARDRAYAPFITGDDGKAGYPWLRRRGPVALIGLSSSVATAPLLAQGVVGPAQRARLGELLAETRGMFRLVLIHHPPAGPCKARRHLRDRRALAEVVAAHGAELMLHGHNHRAQAGWIDGAARTPVFGAPSASIGFGHRDEPAEWRLIRITKAGAGWEVDILRRRITRDLGLEDYGRFTLSAPQFPG